MPCGRRFAGVPPLPFAAGRSASGGLQGRRPCTPAGMSSPHPLFYNIAPKGAGYALTLRRTFIKAWESVPEHAEYLFEAYLSTTSTISKTVSRAAQPNLHSGRLRLLLQVAARPATSQAGRIIK